MSARKAIKKNTDKATGREKENQTEKTERKKNTSSVLCGGGGWLSA